MLLYTPLKHNREFTSAPKRLGGSLQSERTCLADRRGFTLLETLVAITILISAIVGTLSLASQSLSAAFFARDQITAFYLASEAVEYVRNKRDSNVLKSGDWLTGFPNATFDLTPCIGIGTMCTVDPWNDDVDACSGAHDTCPVLRYDTTKFIYNYGASDEPTVFKRSVTIIEKQPDVEAEITVTVSWHTKSLDRSFTIRENIFNWQQNF